MKKSDDLLEEVSDVQIENKNIVITENEIATHPKLLIKV